MIGNWFVMIQCVGIQPRIFQKGADVTFQFSDVNVSCKFVIEEKIKRGAAMSEDSLLIIHFSISMKLSRCWQNMVKSNKSKYMYLFQRSLLRSIQVHIFQDTFQ